MPFWLRTQLGRSSILHLQDQHQCRCCRARAWQERNRAAKWHFTCTPLAVEDSWYLSQFLDMHSAIKHMQITAKVDQISERNISMQSTSQVLKKNEFKSTKTCSTKGHRAYTRIQPFLSPCVTGRKIADGRCSSWSPSQCWHLVIQKQWRWKVTVAFSPAKLKCREKGSI